jgi:demethylmenaquinone methyltransferase/2-methoxy-6-polyprenyl-1,4-benzoquinol methylase
MKTATKPQQTTHFGFEEVPIDEKVKRVGDVFHSVADKYDLMNDLMSLGLHRLWKRFAVQLLLLHKGDKVLDLAGGTGDLTALISKKVGDTGSVCIADINDSMLRVGADRLLDKGLHKNIEFILANAEMLPFESNYFDRMIIGFGLRNVTDKDAALRSMFRCLKPGGKALILEFSKPIFKLINKIYDGYSFNLLPKIGKLVTDDEDSYRYLAESIRKHPDQKTLKSMMEQTGFEDCEYHNLATGIVAIHTGYKY